MFGREHGSKAGSAGVASAHHTEMHRKERLKKLAMESVDLSKDPYLFRNNHGSLECRLCHTIHQSEQNYLIHQQARRHQTNLARREAQTSAASSSAPTRSAVSQPNAKRRKTVKIGRPGFRVTKQRCQVTQRHSLLFQLMFPDIESNLQPRHRFMSCYEQQALPIASGDWQLLVFSAEPYENVAFKLDNSPICSVTEEEARRQSEGKIGGFYTHWDPLRKVYSLQFVFKEEGQVKALDPETPEE